MGFVVGTRPCGGCLEFLDEGDVCGRGVFLIYALSLRLPCNMNKMKIKKKNKANSPECEIMKAIRDPQSPQGGEVPMGDANTNANTTTGA